MFRWQIALLLLVMWGILLGLVIETKSVMFEILMPLVALGFLVYVFVWSLVLLFSKDTKPQE